MFNSNLFSKNPDAELNRKAFILTKGIWSVSAIISLSFVVNMFLQPAYLSRYALIILLIWAVSFPLLFAAKKGYVYLSALAYVSFLLLMIIVFSWSGGGIKGHGMKLLPVVVLFAGLTLGKKEVWLFGIIATLGGLVLFFGDYLNQLPVEEPLGQSSLVYWIYTLTAIILLCFLENLSVKELRAALAKSQHELLLREKAEKILEEKNKKLTEIAFLQSHQVRRPVANILGLVNLLNLDNPNDTLHVELIPKIAVATKELDAIIQEIVQKTSDNK